MKRKAQPRLTADGQQALDQYKQVLQHLEDFSLVTVRNYLSDLRQFISWCEAYWTERQEERTFTPQAVAPALLIRYREYLQTSLSLKPSTVNRTIMSLKRYFAWTRKVQLIQADPASPIKFLPKEATPPRHLSNDEEEALVAVVNATGTLRDQTIITLLLHTSLRAQELCTLTRQLLHLGKRKKVREVPLNTTARLALNQYLETLPPEEQYLFPSEKTHRALTGRALGHLVTKYATRARVPDLSPYDLRHRFGYRMAEVVPLHRLAQIMGHDSLDTTMLYVRGTKQDLQQDVEKIAWI
ncbi:MAG TPA: tyrosine-type recombinase/integrase [Ktedonobacteraceae bacterium]|nr:tyrosine-type recombinase/integrase [Ktedonobacteraceae bacterium]